MNLLKELQKNKKDGIIIMKEFFTEKEALNNILEFLKDDSTDYYVADLQNYIFNEGYYIIGYAEAEKALNQYGIWNAIDEVKSFEEFEFGEVDTDLANSVDVANMLEFIIGYNVIYSLNSIDDYVDNNLNGESNEEGKTVRQVIINEINSRIK